MLVGNSVAMWPGDDEGKRFPAGAARIGHQECTDGGIGPRFPITNLPGNRVNRERRRAEVL